MIANIFNLNNKVAIVTGGYGYLGTGVVRALLNCEATVIVAGRSIEKYVLAFSENERELLNFRIIDITKTESIEKFYSEVMQEFGRLDVLVNNAHASKGNSQENMSDEDWSYTFEGVVGSVHKMIRGVIPIMKRQKSGKIINISSMYGLVSPDFSLYQGDGCEKYTNPPHYGAAKAAINQLTRYFAVLMGPYGVQVNAIAPGPFPNQVVQKENPIFIDRLKKKNPLSRIGKPEDLAGIVALLSSSGSDFISGQTIQVDGGWSIW